MNRQTEIENIIRTLWDIDDVTIDVESKNAIKKALQSLQDVRIALKKENNNFKNVRGIGSSCKPIKSGYDNEIYRQAFGALLEDYAPEGNYPGGYRVLVDGNYETEFSANSREEAIQKFKDYFANKKNGVNSSRRIKSSRENINGYDCLVVDKDYVDDHDLYFSDYITDNDVVEWSLFHDDEDTYYAVKGEY